MALTPSNTDNSQSKREQMQAAQDEALLREVDDAYRQGQYSDFAKRYGKPLIGLVIAGLAAFGGYLFWENKQQENLEKQSEQIVSALDQIQAGNFDTGSKTLDSVVASGEAGPATIARLLQAGIAAQKDDPKKAAELFAQVAADPDAPQEMRNLATIRELSLTFDDTDPAKVIERLRPFAAPGNPWFGSAGELVAMAYLEQGKKAEAGALLAEVAKSEDVPESIKLRARRMAGYLGVDAVEDVDDLLADQEGNAAPVAAAAQ